MSHEEFVLLFFRVALESHLRLQAREFLATDLSEADARRTGRYRVRNVQLAPPVATASRGSQSGAGDGDVSLLPC